MDARPLFWTDKDRRRHGYEPEAAASVAAAMGLTVRWEFRKWAEFKPTLDAHEADAIWCGCAITPAREQAFLFSRSYAIFDEAVLIRRGDPYSSPKDLTGRRVGAIAGSTNMALAEQWPGCERVAFDGTSDDVFGEMIESLRNGHLDAVVDDEPAFGGCVEEGSFDIAFVVPTANRWGAAMRMGDRNLAAAINEGIGTVIHNGELRQIWERWFAPKPFPL
ncbi:MAG: transporter substrate-binding domain-containing protein [Gammaproteobacteria bacterium]